MLPQPSYVSFRRLRTCRYKSLLLLSAMCGRPRVGMCGRPRVGKENLHVAGLVGAAMCSAFRCGSHDRWP
jgi:hypothetical protein